MLICVLMFLFGNSIGFQGSIAVEWDCIIYNEVLSFLNEGWRDVKHFYKTPDPMDTVLNRLPMKRGHRYAWKFFIVKYTSTRDVDTGLEKFIIRSFEEVLRDTVIDYSRFIRSRREKITGCKFNGVRYQFYETPAYGSIIEEHWQQSVEIEDDDTVHYVPLLIQFSEVFYSEGLELAIVAAATYAGYKFRIGFTQAYYFVFQYEGGRWRIRDYKVIPR